MCVSGLLLLSHVQILSSVTRLKGKGCDICNNCRTSYKPSVTSNSSVESEDILRKSRMRQHFDETVTSSRHEKTSSCQTTHSGFPCGGEERLCVVSRKFGISQDSK